MFKKLIPILLCLLLMPTIGLGSESKKNNGESKVAIHLNARRIKPRDNSSLQVTCFYINNTHELYISFPDSEGWADLVITTISGELVFKDRFHSGFEYCKYIGVPDMPWKIEVNTTQGGAYEGWLILQE